MQDTAGGVRHLIELVDTADAVVGQDEGARLEDELFGLGILGDVGGQTDSRASLSGGVLRARNQVEDVLEQLGFAGTGVTAQKDVDLGAEGSAPDFREVFPGASEQLEQDTFLDVLVLVDGRGDGPSQTFVNIRLLGQILEQSLSFSAEPRLFSIVNHQQHQ